MLARNDALEARLRHVETKPSLDLDAVDVAIERIRRPDVVREQSATPCSTPSAWKRRSAD